MTRRLTIFLLATAMLLVILMTILGRPVPGRAAATAHAALAEARAAGAHRLAPALYREAEMAYLAGRREAALSRERWLPSHRRSREQFQRAARLAGEAAVRAREGTATSPQRANPG